MKIRFKRIKIKNFLSVGNDPIEYEYRSGLNMVIGKNRDTMSANGCGKSAIIVDALMFALFGKSVRNVNKIDLVNSQNMGGCEVEVEFTKNRDTYIIIQGVEPRFISIYKNGNKLPSESTLHLDIKKISKIIGGDFATFLNTNFTCINYTKPFIELGKYEKRKILEDILGISIFGDMFEIAHSNFTEAKLKHDELHSEIKHLSKLVEERENHTKSLEGEKSKFEDRRRGMINDLKSKFYDIREMMEESKSILEGKEDHEAQVEKTNTNLLKAREESEALTVDSRLISARIKRAQEDLDSLEKDQTCSKCGTPVTADTVKDHMKGERKQLKKDSENLISIEKKAMKKKENIEKLENEKKNINEESEKISLAEYKMKSAKDSAKEIKKKIKEITSERFEIERLINRKEMDKDIIRLQNLQKRFLENFQIYQYSEAGRSVLSEKGVKAYIIREILPYLNSRINFYLKKLAVPFTIKFDEELNESIRFNNRSDFGYGNFSGGEKRRIDLGLMLTLLDISKKQNVIDCNLQILDEVIDTSLDSEGVELFQNILRERILEDPEKAIFIITHRSEINAEHYDRIMRITKEKGFTSLEEV